MRKIALTLMALGCCAIRTYASDWSLKLGLDAGSFGGLVVHDFMTKASLSGLEWDGEHIQYKGNEAAEIGVFAAERDFDKHFLIGPSFGVPGTDLGVIAQNAETYFDWGWLPSVADYGKYVHAYFNIGWDFSRANLLKARPDLVGLGGVLKFGAK